MTLLEVRDLSVSFATDRGWVEVLDRVSFHIEPGEVVGLVGESGSGKSVTSLAIMRLLPPRQSRITNGAVLLEGNDLLALSEHQMEDVRGDRVAMIFQEPMTSLNPSMTVGEQIAEVVRRHRHASRPRAHAVAVEMLDRVGHPRRGSTGTAVPARVLRWHAPASDDRDRDGV